MAFSNRPDIVLTGVDDGSAAWGDYDNDGNQDILITGATGELPTYNPVSKLYHNNGDNSFTEQTGTELTGVLWSAVAWADCENDGDLDMLITGYTGTVYISKISINNGAGGFTELCRQPFTRCVP